MKINNIDELDRIDKRIKEFDKKLKDVIHELLNFKTDLKLRKHGYKLNNSADNLLLGRFESKRLWKN